LYFNKIFDIIFIETNKLIFVVEWIIREEFKEVCGPIQLIEREDRHEQLTWLEGVVYGAGIVRVSGKVEKLQTQG
jgi:hypothetical protein